MNKLIESLYSVESDRKAFGRHWCFEGNQFEHAKSVLIARYPKQGDGGQPVEVYCEANPARFFRIVTSSLQISTGSSMDLLVADIAEALSKGMLSIEANIKLFGPN